MIITEYVQPPVPFAKWDWRAFVEGQEESGIQGTGSTEAEALRDLGNLLLQAHDEHKLNYRRACKTVADMHAAATGRVGEAPIRGVIEDVADMKAERDRLAAEVEALGADAERYRWLRNEADPDAENPYVTVHKMNSWGKWFNTFEEGAALDEAIDAARGIKKGGAV